MAKGRLRTLFGVHRRARPTGAAGRPARGAGADRPGRHGGHVAAAGAVRAAAPRHQEHARRRPAGRRSQPRRRELLRNNNLDGTLQEIKKLLDEAVLAERKELARALDDDARFGELQLESLSPSPAKAVQELVRLRLAQRRGTPEVRADQGSARPRDARPALRRHEAGAGERHRRGPSARQRHARRPQRPAGQALERPGLRSKTFKTS